MIYWGRTSKLFRILKRYPLPRRNGISLQANPYKNYGYFGPPYCTPCICVNVAENGSHRKGVYTCLDNIEVTAGLGHPTSTPEQGAKEAAKLKEEKFERLFLIRKIIMITLLWETFFLSISCLRHIWVEIPTRSSSMLWFIPEN